MAMLELDFRDLKDEELAKEQAASNICSALPKLASGTNKTKEKVADMLIEMIQQGGEEVSGMMVQEGAVKPLVQLMSSGSGKVKERAAVVMDNLATFPTTHKTLIQEGAIPSLIKLLSISTTQAQAASASALGRLACNNTNSSIISTSGAIKPLILLLSTGSDTTKEAAAGTLLNITFHYFHSLLELSEAGAITPLLHLLPTGTTHLKEVVTSLLGYLAPVVDSCALNTQQDTIKSLIHHLPSTNGNPQQILIRLLHNLAKNNNITQIQITNEGGIQPLMHALVTGESVKTREDAMQLLLWLSTNVGASAAVAKQSGIVRVLVRSMTYGSNTIKENAIQALCSLSASHHEQIEIQNPIKHLAKLMQNDDNVVLRAVILALGDLAAATPAIREKIVQEEAVVKRLISITNAHGICFLQVPAARVLVLIAINHTHHPLLARMGAFGALVFLLPTVPNNSTPMAIECKQMIISLLSNPSTDMQQAVKTAFGKLKFQFFPSGNNESYQTILERLSCTLPMGTPIPPLSHFGFTPSTSTNAAPTAASTKPPNLDSKSPPQQTSTQQPTSAPIQSPKATSSTTSSTSQKSDTPKLREEPPTPKPSSQPTPKTTSPTTPIVPSLSSSKSPPPSTPATTHSPPATHLQTWKVSDVLLWLSSLNLSKDYRKIFEENHITGLVLRTMNKDDWKEVGVTVFGDIRILLTAVAQIPA